jgi:hypothetical protein
VIAAAFVVACFVFFQWLLPVHLFFREQTSLFLFTSDAFLAYWEKPGGAACYVGDFLTQFFYLRGGGALVLSLCFGVEYCLVTLTLKRIGVGRLSAWVALVPVTVEVLLHCGLYYGLAGTLSVMLVCGGFLLYSLLKAAPWNVLLGLGLGGLLYVVAGAAFLLFPLLVLLYEWHKKLRRFGYWIALGALCGLLPLGLRSFYLLSLRQAYRYPFPVLSLSGVDRNREKILALAVEGSYGNWDEVARRAENDKLPNPIASYYANIALSKQGRLGEELLNYYQAFDATLFLPVNAQADWLTIFFSNEVFYHLGDMNMAQHSAMLGMIFSPQRRSVRMIRRLAEINIVNGDTTAARKYIRILDETIFHRAKAAEYESLLTHPSQTPDWLTLKRQQIPRRDTLRTAADYPAALALLIESNPTGNQATDYLLCYYLLNKQLPAFGAAFDRYCLGQTVFIPRIYYEALLIRLVAAKTSKEELQRYAIPDQITGDFLQYTRLYESSDGNMDALRPAFATTYWFYYHFAQAVRRT